MSLQRRILTSDLEQDIDSVENATDLIVEDTIRGGVDSLRPISGHVVLEPAYDPDETPGGIVVPLDARQRYPQIGWCIATASNAIKLGDLCLINVESSDIARLYRKVLALHLLEWGTELFEPDVEPAIREAVDAYRANPSTHNNRIRAETLKGEHLAFLCSDVLSLEWTETDQPGFSLLYPLFIRMATVAGQLYYFVHEDHIMGVIE